MKKSKNDFLTQVLKAVSETTLIPEIEIVGKKRNRPISDARKIFCHVVYKNKNSISVSLEEVGTFINRDHATVITNKNQADNVKLTDPMFSNMLEKVHSIFDRSTMNVEAYNFIPQL